MEVHMSMTDQGDEGLGQVCEDCGHDIPLNDVTGQYKGKCAKCRELEQDREEMQKRFRMEYGDGDT